MEKIEPKTGFIVEVSKPWLVSLLCLLVIFGTVAVTGIMDLPAGPGGDTAKKADQNQLLIQPRAVFSFSPAEIILEKAGSASFDLNLSFEKEVFLDGVDIVLIFDSQMVEIIEVVPSEIFSFSVFRKDDLQKGRISVTFLEERGGGIGLSGNNELMTVKLKAKKAGESVIEILEAEKGVTTVITENGTSRKIDFKGESLKVK